jgi:probable HAF family extracellular repeat protein
MRKTLSILLLLAAAPAVRAGVVYQVTDLGTLGGGSYAVAFGINQHGQVTGFSESPGPGGESYDHAFLWTAGAMTDLGTLGGGWSEGRSVNDSGQVAGWSYLAGNNTIRGFLYSGGTMTRLGTLGGSGSDAYGINNSGQVTGTSAAPAGAFRAFRYGGGVMTDLGGTFSSGWAINDAGQVTGDSSARAVLWSGGIVTDLGTLGGLYSSGRAINASGTVAGAASLDSGLTHAFLYADGAVSDLGTLGGDYSEAYGINSAGAVVGTSSTTTAFHAFVYSGGAMQDLNDLIDPALGITLGEARGINDAGQIIANSGDAFTRAYLLTPLAQGTEAPEPGGAALFGCGLLAAAVRRRVRSAPVRVTARTG